MRLARWTLALLLTVALAGCDDDATAAADGSGGRRDGGADGPGADSGSPADLGDGGLVPDAGSDGTPPPDGPARDLPTGPGTVLFSINPTAGRYTLWRVQTDGSNSQLISSAPGNLALNDLLLAGANGPITVRADRPQQRQLEGDHWIALPGGRQLVAYTDGTHDGLALIDGAQWVALDQGVAPDGYAAAAGDYAVAVSADGTRAAAVKGGDHLVLLRLDGTTWSNGQSALDRTPGGVTIDAIASESLTLLSSALLFVAEIGGAPRLFRLPLDGSAAASEVPLPDLGAPLTRLEPQLAVSADGSAAALIAGIGPSAAHVLRVRATGAATRATTTAGDYQPAGRRLLTDDEPRLALSPSGQGVALIAVVDGDHQVQLVRADGSQLTLSRPELFDAALDYAGAFHWVDEDNLLLWAGATATSCDLFRYQVGIAQLDNLTLTGDQSQAPWGPGQLDLEGGWIAPDGGHLYLVFHVGQEANLIGIDLQSYAGRTITSGLRLPTHEAGLRDDYRALAGSRWVWFVGRPAGVVPVQENVYRFDQLAASAASNLTNHTTPTLVKALRLSPDDRHAAFQMGSGDLESLWIVSGATPPLEVSSATTALNTRYAWTADGVGVIYGAALDETRQVLRYATTSGPSPLVLYDTLPGLLAVFGVQ